MMMKDGILGMAALALLVGCECAPEASKTAISNDVIQEEEAPSLAGALADLIAKAGGDRAFFAFDKSTLNEEGQKVMTAAAEWLKAHPERKVLIEGHCDERGTREYNLGLGERRAAAVAEFLISHGVEAERVKTISYGKDRPIEAQGTKAEIYRMNRVSILVLE